MLGDLVAGNMLTTESNEADRIHRVSRTWDHNRMHRFPPHRIGHAEDGGFQDGRVLVEQVRDKIMPVQGARPGESIVVGEHPYECTESV